MHIRVGARSSPLSLKQVEEVFRALPGVTYELTAIETVGDVDRLTSLRELAKTDFFTRELDLMLDEGKIDVVIHSAKDLPSTLREGQEIIALTQCVDPRDSLAYTSLPPKVIATSSKQREKTVRKLFPEANFCDIRGTIGERIAIMKSGKVDGVVIAEAALLRLGLGDLPRIYLPGNTTEHQGQLAITAKKNRDDLKTLFRPLDVRTLHRT